MPNGPSRSHSTACQPPGGAGGDGHAGVVEVGDAGDEARPRRHDPRPPAQARQRPACRRGVGIVHDGLAVAVAHDDLAGVDIGVCARSHGERAQQ